MTTYAAKDQTILITGATDGIGKATALELLRRGARVLVHGRSQAKANEVERELRRESGSDDTAVLVADFTSLAAVRRLAEGGTATRSTASTCTSRHAATSTTSASRAGGPRPRGTRAHRTLRSMRLVHTLA